MEALSSVGKVAEKIADGLSDNTNRFILLFIFFIGSFGAFLTTGDVALAVILFALAPMLLLFGLLRPEWKPRGWQAIWTFYLLISYVGIAILIIFFAFYIRFGDRDISLVYETNWQKNYNKANSAYALEVENIVRNVASEKDKNTSVFDAIYQKIDGNKDFKAFVIRTTEFLEEWERCRSSRCRLAEAQTNFDSRIFDFWANYRCFVASLRGNGYDKQFGYLIEKRYESNSEVKGVRNALNISGESLRVC